MTGPEHYREAELLLAAAEKTSTNYDETNPAAALLFAEAQVHATLALAAAQVARLADRYVGDGDHINDWLNAVGRGAPARIPNEREADPAA